MVVSAKYNVIDLEKGLLDRGIYTDERVYQDELEKIFGQAWLWVGHESLVPNPNDFFLNYMGEDPVILTRDSKGQLHVFLNMCRHRGNRVVRADDGNAKNFMCTYHGWTFSNEGKLVSVPGLQEAYYGELDMEHLGLVEARLDTYAGLIFATWAHDAPTLEAYLGDLRWYLDGRYNKTDNGIQVVGPVKWILPSNWKVPVDNAMGDVYHVSTTHFSSRIVEALFKGAESAENSRMERQLNRPGAMQLNAGNGHGVMATLREASIQVERATGARLPPNVPEGARALAYANAQHGELVRRLGWFRANRVQGGGSVFPNKFLGTMLAHPRGPYKTEVWSFIHHDKDTPEGLVRDIRVRSTQVGAGHPGGTMMQDDMNNWRSVTEAGLSPAGRRVWQDLSMGIRHEGKNPDMPGVSVSHRAVSETGQRGFYTRWQEFMNAERWTDIHIDPITAKFEGTATMKG